MRAKFFVASSLLCLGRCQTLWTLLGRVPRLYGRASRKHSVWVLASYRVCLGEGCGGDSAVASQGEPQQGSDRGGWAWIDKLGDEETRMEARRVIDLRRRLSQPPTSKTVTTLLKDFRLG